MITEEEQETYGPIIRDIMTQLRRGVDGETIASTLVEQFGFGHFTSARLVEKTFTLLHEDENASIIDLPLDVPIR